MNRANIIAILAIGFSFALAGNAMAKAAPCKDANGKFIKCPAAAAPAAKPTATASRCKDANGKFVKCPAPVAAAATIGKPVKAVTTSMTTTSNRCKDANGKFIKCSAPVTTAAVASKPATTTVHARQVSATLSSGIPTHASPGSPAGATAQCKDGTFSQSKQHSGACSRHGGVANWL